jgi:GNAT superfamily N-acetyltransferase
MSERIGEIADGRADEAGTLSDLALRSKAHWGYGAAFLEACRDELTLKPEQAAGTRVVRDLVGTVLGFHLLAPDPDDRPGRGELLMLFVDPSAMGSGIGRVLLEDAVASAARRGWTALRVESDPGAEGFYVRHGARRVGWVPSGSVAERELPLLELPVSAA